MADMRVLALCCGAKNTILQCKYWTSEWSIDMTDYAAKPYARLPETPRTSGSSWKAPKLLKGLSRTMESFVNACQAASEYERRSALTGPAHSGDIAREVFTKYFDGR